MLLIILGGKYLNQNLEIEFKNELTEEEYFLLVKKEFEGLSHSKHMTFQTNYYFDTISQLLKKQSSVLRIRVTEANNELTFKVPAQGFLMETNYTLTDDQVTEILQSRSLQLSSYIPSTLSIPALEHISKDTVFKLWNQFQTKRLEKQVGEHLIVLDQTTFQNGIVDYELEVEATEAESGRLFMNTLLDNYGISLRRSLPKIARADRFKDKI